MDPRTQERVTSWESRQFSGGYDGLSDLAENDFSGAVESNGSWLFMLNGRVVGVIDGEVDDFEAASGTVYYAPDRSLPLLSVMFSASKSSRAKYYTNETPLAEVDETLQDGAFTGYVEMSDGVLSGDYYLVYYGGKRMAAAYIGNAERLLTGDEAFDRAADEVGIYEVYDVDVDVTDIPSTGRADSGTEVSAGSKAEPESESESEPEPESESESEPEPELNGISKSAAVDRDTSVDANGRTNVADARTDQDDAIADVDTPDDDEITGGVGVTAAGPSGTSPHPESEGSQQSEAERKAGFEGEDEGEGERKDEGEGERKDEGEGERERQSERGRETETDPIPSRDVELTDDSDSTVVSADQQGPSSGQRETSSGRNESTAEETLEYGHNEEYDPNESMREPTGASSPNRNHSDRAGSATDRRGPIGDSDPTDSTEREVGAANDEGFGVTTSANPDPETIEAAAEALEEGGLPWNSTGDEEPAKAEPIESESPNESDLEHQFEREEQWRETRQIPSIDPDKTEETSTTDRTGTSVESSRSVSQNDRSNRIDRRESEASQRSKATADRSNTATETETEAGTAVDGTRPTDRLGPDTDRDTESDGRVGGEPAGVEGDRTGTDDARSNWKGQERTVADTGETDARTLKRRVTALEERRTELEETIDRLESDRDRLKAENEDLTGTIDRLQARIEDLETTLERTREAHDTTGQIVGGAGPAGERERTSLTPARALSETNIFVRYGSKSQPTLQSAITEEADSEAVRSNLTLERHTTFDTSTVTVEDTSYEGFLTDTLPYRFVEWLTGTLVFEIRDTGRGDELADLYDVIPLIDRVEFRASISLEDDDTEDVPDSVTFDVVAFDKMGVPLVVANLNDSREPATRDLLVTLEETASAVNANYPELGTAFAVTSSFFEPGALEVTERATSSGFLTRGGKTSYVNLSRKQGYHLCLLESRSGGFHMTVPEL